MSRRSPIAVARRSPPSSKDEGGNVTIVLQMYMHCVGSAKKVKRFVSNIQGVEDVLADAVDNKLMVIGKVDPLKIKEKLQEKTSMDVDLVSPRPAKNDGDKGKETEVKVDKKKPSDEKKQPEDEKPKGATTAVLKMRLHCEVCISAGIMDVGELATYLREKLKRSVQLVPLEKDDGSKKGKKDGDTDSKKDKEKEKESDGDGKKEEEEKEKVTAAGGGGEAKVESDGRGGRRRRQQQQQWPMHREGEGHMYSQQYAYTAPTSVAYAVEPHPYHRQ